MVCEDIKERAKSCSDCMCWLDVCKGECCRVFVVKTDIPSFKKGQHIVIKYNLSQDMIRYFKIHGCTYSNGILSFTLKKFKLENGELFVYKKCKHHGSDYKCKIYHKRPEICRELNYETRNREHIYLTENCLFKIKE
jgi:Fe-S-cluster containining protein